ncbi:tRNA pseudouridine 13 synthase [Thioalkalivibrio nitratireducens DSM 14787]|uniref:tRNA pseudouridine synthase D n=1 Tax=Thioalkalivibrio nitratireducens (strain DSM 14787 / UNIQEM 213 / ALEN2) TaxID=1255043 RepID=L0E067_THIND|nr:tRNA pseudouridine 13 synthase [Thioalkalivibrio nitratireducens DSM 14787]
MYPWGLPLLARIKACPEDFVVDEIPATQPSGEGTHVWLQIRKVGRNTEDVAEWLARAAGVARVAVGYAGRKDRLAVTTQWFSVDLAGRQEPDWNGTVPDGVEILDRRRHARKLKTGHLRGNRFRLRLRAVRGDRQAADALLGRIRERGLPAYFGEQRFGHANLERARAWFAGRTRPRSRNQRGLYLSAARAAIFNEVLGRRVREGTWDRLLAGDLANLDGRGSVFPVPVVDAELEARCARLEIHPTGPLWGRGGPGSDGEALALEREVAGALRDLADGLEREGLDPARRPLRLRPRNLAWAWLEPDMLQLEIELGPGEYATGVAEAIAHLAETARSDPSA